jgi:hypothetical protein
VTCQQGSFIPPINQCLPIYLSCVFCWSYEIVYIFFKEVFHFQWNHAHWKVNFIFFSCTKLQLTRIKIIYYQHGVQYLHLFFSFCSFESACISVILQTLFWLFKTISVFSIGNILFVSTSQFMQIIMCVICRWMAHVKSIWCMNTGHLNHPSHSQRIWRWTTVPRPTSACITSFLGYPLGMSYM